jgi:tartrate-resistant acid phosphatase type 5
MNLAALVPLLMFASCGQTQASAPPYSFSTIGDWGGAQISEQDSTNVYAVANAMATTASVKHTKFIINTGDNFYWCGIQNTSDPQISTDFELPYRGALMDLTWYSALGNHEYGYNVDAQISYGQINSQWYMPARYYTKRIQMDGDNYMSLIFLDTSPCVSDYRKDDKKYWDPCSTEYPTCSQKSTDDDFEGPCQFNENIRSQNCDTQYQWFKSAIMGVPADDWLVVVGHHPIDELDVKDFATVLIQHGFGLYLNGHTHTLNRYTLNYSGAYVTSGAGSLVDTADQQHPVTAAKMRGENVPGRPLQDHSGMLGVSYQSVEYDTVAGFVTSTFSSDFSKMTIDFVKYTNEVVYSFDVLKNGTTLN